MSEKKNKNKRYTCKWEPNCDDDCRRPYGNCPDNCPNYKENKSVEEFEKENEQLKKEISVLLSCANCSENKGGYICGKEYNDKCLLQKIEYIKELEEQIEKMKCCENCKNCEINFTNDHGIKHGCKKLGRKCDDCILNNYYHWELKE